MRKTMMMMAAFAALPTGSAVSAKGLLGQFLDAVTQPTASPSAPVQPPVLVKPSEQQIADLRALIAKAGETPGVEQEMADAAPLIERGLMTVGCATDASALHSLNRVRLKPVTYRTGDDTLNRVAMGLSGVGMPYHDRRTCVDPFRIREVRKPALNALQMTVDYLSASSGEARSNTFSFRKIDGDWLLDEIGYFH